MSEITFNYYPQYFTATILEWKQLLADDKMKDVIVSSLQFLVKNKRIIIYGFAPITIGVPNHIHLIWQIQDGYEKAKVQQSFLKYTAQQMKFMLAKADAGELAKYKVKASDREYLPIAIGMGTQSFNYRFMEQAGISSKASIHS